MKTRTIHCPNTFHAPSSAGMPGVDAPAPADGSAKAPLPRRGTDRGAPANACASKRLGSAALLAGVREYDEAGAESNVGARRWACPPLTGRRTPRTRRSPWQRCANSPRQEARRPPTRAMCDELDAQRRTGDLRTCRARQDDRRSPGAKSPDDFDTSRQNPSLKANTVICCLRSGGIYADDVCSVGSPCPQCARFAEGVGRGSGCSGWRRNSRRGHRRSVASRHEGTAHRPIPRRRPTLVQATHPTHPTQRCFNGSSTLVRDRRRMTTRWTFRLARVWAALFTASGPEDYSAASPIGLGVELRS